MEWNERLMQTFLKTRPTPLWYFYCERCITSQTQLAMEVLYQKQLLISTCLVKYSK